MSEVVAYTIEFQSDWHIGTGVSRSGDVDRLVARDAEGMPFVPAKSLTGMWRDAVEQLQLALPDSDSGVVEELFGSQPNRGRAAKPAGVSVRPARYRSAFRSAVADDPSLEGHLTTTRSSTAIDDQTGTARERTLRVVEVGRATSVLEGTVAFAPGLSERARDVFLAASKLIEGVGAKRRRGLGRCNVRLRDGIVDAAVQRLVAGTVEGAGQGGPSTSTPPQPNESAAHGGDGEHLFHLDLITELPVVIAREVLGNVVRTHRAPTGSSLLPAISAVLRAEGIDARALVASGRLAVSDAVPVWRDHELLPMPLAFSAVKHDTADQPTLHNTLRAQPNAQSKQQRTGWVQDEPSSPAVAHVAVQQRTHATIDDRSQRPTAEVGGVFTYEAISPFQRFRCTIRLDVADDMAARALDALQRCSDLSLGTSRKDDYGLVRVVSATAAESSRINTDAITGRLTVWCTSDVIVLDRFLRPRATAECLADAICSAMGLPEGALRVQHDAVRMRPVRRDAWHTAWGLPRPTLVAIGAGSVATLELVDGVSITGHQVRALQRVGVGERTAEGFGRVLLNPALLSAAQVQPQHVETVVSPRISSRDALTSAENALLRVIAADAHRSWLQAKVAEKRSAFEKVAHLGSVSLTQLQALRNRLDTDDAFGANGTALAWFNDTAAKRWPEKARDGIQRLLADPDEHLWRVLDVDDGPPLLGAHAMRSFVEAVARARSRRGDDDGSR